MNPNASLDIEIYCERCDEKLECKMGEETSKWKLVFNVQPCVCHDEDYESYDDGVEDGYENGYDEGYTIGDEDGHTRGYDEGYEKGLEEKESK